MTSLENLTRKEFCSCFEKRYPDICSTLSNKIAFPFKKAYSFFTAEGKGIGRAAYTMGKISATAGVALSYIAEMFSRAQSEWGKATYIPPENNAEGFLGFCSNFSDKIRSACKDPIIEKIKQDTDLGDYSQFFNNIYSYAVCGDSSLSTKGQIGYFISENFEPETISSMFDYASVSYTAAIALMASGTLHIAYNSLKKR